MFLVAVGFWNFLGAGIFGFLINLPIVSYYEIGTALTANHGHTAMMGVYGMLAVGLAMFCLRYLIPAERWNERAAKMSFWGLNIGLAWMSFATLFPLGIRQLYESVNVGYFDARSLDYLSTNTNTVIEWLRLPGDVYFIVVGVLPLLYLMLPRRPPHGQAGDDRGAGGDPVHRDDRAQAAGGGTAVSGVATECCSRPATGSSWSLAALGLDALARHSHRRSELYRTAGFTYLEHRRCLGVPGGRAASPGRDRPAAAARPLPGPGARLQRLPAKGGLHRLRPRPRDHPGARSLAALRGGPLPPRDRRRDGRLRDAGDLRRRRPQPRGGGPRGARRRALDLDGGRASTCSPTSAPPRRAFPGRRGSEAARRQSRLNLSRSAQPRPAERAGSR